MLWGKHKIMREIGRILFSSKTLNENDRISKLEKLNDNKTKTGKLKLLKSETSLVAEDEEWAFFKPG